MSEVQMVAAIREITARVMAIEQVTLSTLDPKQRERYFRQVEENRKGMQLPPLDGRDPLELLLVP